MKHPLVLYKMSKGYDTEFYERSLRQAIFVSSTPGHHGGVDRRGTEEARQEGRQLQDQQREVLLILHVCSCWK